MKRANLQTALKALLLLGMGLFLFTRLTNGSLYFYINQRFAGLTLLAVLGLLIVGFSYQFGRQNQTDDDASEPAHANCDRHAHDDHAHDHHLDGHHHHHSLAWGGALLVALPILLGLFVPPRPLGASALQNREVSVGASNRSSMPAAVRNAGEKSNLDRNILDWVYEFQTAELEQFVDEEAEVVGFVFRDERFGEEEFLISRYVVSCCVADAAYVGLVVRWPDAPALETDQWVRVRGRFAMGQLEEEPLPVLVADEVTPTEMPNQPYLYP